MKLNVRAFGLAVGIAIAAAFTICPFFVAVAPEATADFIGYLLHINLFGLTRPVTWTSYFAGVVAVGIWTALWAGVAAKLYNFSVLT
jgi:hydrogenase/urease accessory protein HupE